MPLSDPPEPDRLPGDWHKLYPDEYEAAVAEAAGALTGAHMGRGERGPMWTDTFLAAFRHAVGVAFCWGYSAAKGDER